MFYELKNKTKKSTQTQQVCSLYIPVSGTESKKPHVGEQL